MPDEIVTETQPPADKWEAERREWKGLPIERIWQERYPVSSKIVKKAGRPSISDLGNDHFLSPRDSWGERNLRNPERLVDFTLIGRREIMSSIHIRDERRRLHDGIRYLEVSRWRGGKEESDLSFLVDTGRFLDSNDFIKWGEDREKAKRKIQEKGKETIRFQFSGAGKTPVALSYNQEGGLKFHGVDRKEPWRGWQKVLSEEEAQEARRVLSKEYGIEAAVFDRVIDVQGTAAAVLSWESSEVFDPEMIKTRKRFSFRRG